jgi:hypothetical protein
MGKGRDKILLDRWGRGTKFVIKIGGRGLKI